MYKLKHLRYAVTGGAGFIGSHICEEIVNQGKEVICIDNLAAGKRSNLLPWWNDKLCRFVWTGIGKLSELEKEFEGVDVVFHNAASKCTVCRDNPFVDLMTNAWGSFCVFEAARRQGVKKVIHASTGSVFNGKPKSFYGVSKMAGEAYLRAFAEYYPEFDFTSIRYHHVFGPRQEAGENGGVIPIFIKGLMNGGNLKVFGDGEQVRSFTHVRDVVKANFIASNSNSLSGKYINISSGIRISINQLIFYLTDIMKRKAEIEYLPSKPGDIKDFNIKNEDMKIHGMSEWMDFKDGLKQTIDWYKYDATAE